MTDENEEHAQLMLQYMQAVNILGAVKAHAKMLARSGNPGRRAAGEDLLSLLEPR